MSGKPDERSRHAANFKLESLNMDNRYTVADRGANYESTSRNRPLVDQ
ncbi:hypothetical protein E3G44_000389 [Mycobacteroides abscessus]|uniref:Uncharacterized protein n=1 Tax=Mycobacteroides abscessus 21 TaxID=1299324 RepID=A0A829Q3L3_9MYCO|nr:hypothetical protein I543_2742 [Mycobacteroides abscessus 21]MBE5492925.1 hypothetical protein [Mycobacteroides abscessus]SHO94931.1 Uncharacterised protein [Mycobacteroides abscessus subsp. abscessus]SHP88953.1 Uncharacterised protein [Mycobacteroides abscessus subsp. abscessus]SHP92181.1 Uncharacterised protein [Mycobacteroides abscessus subsp. abscessus]